MAPRRKYVRRKPSVLAVGSAYLDPIECDSTISYKVIHGSRRLWANVQLSDCSRKIEWYFGNDKTALAKADKAIEILQEFRIALAVALTAKNKTTRKRKTK